MGYGDEDEMTLSKRKTDRRWSEARLEARKKRLFKKLSPEYELKDWDSKEKKK